MHKDYLGSILSISDETGNKIEQRHYDAWGNLTHLQINGGAIVTDENQIRDFLSNGGLLVDSGYTSHEHFAEVGLIHMNGRLYDPLLRRFLNADENIQDMFNTQNYNKYGYVLNNPLMFSDPSGEFFVFLGLGVLFWKAVIIGAAIGLASYTVGLAVTGNIKQWNIGGALKSMFWGAVSGAVTFGIGSIFSSATTQMLTGVGKFLTNNIGQFGLEIVRAGTHAVAQGVMSLMQGGSFQQAFWSGALGSIGAYEFGAVVGSDFANKALGQITFGALSGGIGSELTGGNFWQGAVIGGIVAGLNATMHEIGDPKNDAKAKKLAKEYKTNEDRMVVESLVAETLLESTEVGEFTLKAVREKVIATYGDHDLKRLNEIYSTVGDVFSEASKQLVGKSFKTSGAFDIVKAKIAVGLGADVMNLQARNLFLEYRIRSLSKNVYYEYIRPPLINASFGGGGAKGNW